MASTKGEASRKRHDRQFKAGEQIFREGECDPHLYVVRQGRVSISQQIHGYPTQLATLGPGDFAGEVAVITGQAHTTTATALEASRCLVVDAPTLEVMVANDREIAVRLTRGLATRLALVNDQLKRMASRAATTQLCLAIVKHATKHGQTEDGGLFLPRRFADLGADLALDDQELGELAKLLIREKLLRISRRGMVLPDVDRLRRFAITGQV